MYATVCIETWKVFASYILFSFLYLFASQEFLEWRPSRGIAIWDFASLQLDIVVITTILNAQILNCYSTALAYRQAP